MRFLTVEEVLYLHFQVIDRFGGLHGVRDIAGLQSAVARPQTTVFGNDAYPTLIDKASAMLHSLILNHPFHDGNIRTAFAAVGFFLHLTAFPSRVHTKRLRILSFMSWKDTCPSKPL